MNLKKVIIENFRGYRDETTIDINNLTVFVGKNDIGKSSIMEALDIFFNDTKAFKKIDKTDINIENKKNNKDIKITCVFDNVPDCIKVGDDNISLSKICFLDKDKNLSIKKTYKNASTKYSAELITQQPACSDFSNLYELNQTELKNLVEKFNISCKKNSNQAMREALWQYARTLEKFEEKEITLNILSNEFKDFWNGIKLILPNFMLFRADRENNDEDDEIQNPLKAAVKRVLEASDVIERLDYIADKVKKEIKETADITLKNIAEIDNELSKGLKPVIPPNEDLKWIDVFKNLSFESTNDISLNKRGSGIRRLVLLSFFQAEAENIKKISESKSIIYAIEEPETAQHIENQLLLIKALKKISEAENAQVLITTHSSAIVKEIDEKNILIVTNNSKKIQPPQKRCLDWVSLNEINYTAFNDYSIEYFNELYGYLLEVATKEYIEKNKGKKLYYYTEENFDEWLGEKGILVSKERYRSNKDGTKNETPSKETLETYIRNIIHHPENQFNPDGYTEEELAIAIKEMVKISESLK